MWCSHHHNCSELYVYSYITTENGTIATVSSSEYWCISVFGFSMQDGITSLMMASQEGYLETVKMLLQHNANVNDQDKVTDIERLTE